MFVCAERVKTRDFNCSSGISSSLDVYTSIRPYIVRKRALIYKMPINLAESVFVIFRPPPTHAHSLFWKIIYIYDFSAL